MFFVTAIIGGAALERNPSFKFIRNRTYGYYPTFAEAHAAVTDNVFSMDECCHDFIVIEDIPVGIPAMAEKEWWYQWKHPIWVSMGDSKPSEFAHIINWAIG